MGIIRLSSPRFRLKIVLIIAVVFFASGVSRILWVRGPGYKITDQELLRAAVAECEQAGQRPPSEIFEQQAGQGYYDDAISTSKLFTRRDEQDWAIEELARIRTENGDTQGSKTMIARFSGTPLGKSATKAIALAQAGKGDQRGALETSAPLDDYAVDEVLQALANHQIEGGDLAAALQTSERMKTRQFIQLFYAVDTAIRKKHQEGRIPDLASHLTNPARRKDFVEIARFQYLPAMYKELLPTSCDTAYFAVANEGYAKIDAALEENKCTYVSFVAIRQYAVDPVGAEHLLRSEPFNDDRVYGIEQIAVSAAKKGNITEALRLYSEVQNLKNSRADLFAASANFDDVVKEIARNWTIKEGPRQAVKWAHSRPDTGQHVWALLGVAQALGHARPLKNQVH